MAQQIWPIIVALVVCHLFTSLIIIQAAGGWNGGEHGKVGPDAAGLAGHDPEVLPERELRITLGFHRI